MLPVVFSPRYEVDFGPHVFPTRKYRLVKETLEKEGLIEPGDVEEPQEASDEDLLLTHQPDYLDDLKHCRSTPRTSRSELPITPEIVKKFRLASGGSILAARRALEHGGAYHCGGGFHHAFADHAEGFCYLNDIAVAIRALLHEGRAQRPIVVDCDLHQGNGTACIFQRDPNVFTFSIHEENNYPVKERSDLDIGLESLTDDDGYLKALDRAVPEIYDRHRPDLLFFVAGADPFEDDQLGFLRVSKQGLRRRDERVLAEARARGIPFVVLLAGGYARNVADTVEIHVTTYRVARACLERQGPGPE